MIMRPGQPLLLPASPLFIWGSLIAALMGNMLFNIGGMGRAAWLPDLLALTLVFWNVHQPQRVSVGAAFAFGLAMDGTKTVLLIAVLGFLAVSIHRRLLWFPVTTQAIHVLPLFAAAHALVITIRVLSGGLFPGWEVLLAPVLTAALWPVASILLLAPQRRAHDPDDNRPL